MGIYTDDIERKLEAWGIEEAKSDPRSTIGYPGMEPFTRLVTASKKFTSISPADFDAIDAAVTRVRKENDEMGLLIWFYYRWFCKQEMLATYFKIHQSQISRRLDIAVELIAQYVNEYYKKLD